MNSIERVERINEVKELHLQGMSDTAIAKQLSIAVKDVRGYLQEWNDYIAERASKDPDILDRHLENVFKFEDQLDLINKKIWEVVQEADENSIMSTKIQALRLAKDLTEMKAKLFQLMSPRIESGYLERMKKVERVNNVLSSIIKEVVADCPRCGDRAFRMLEEAFSIMGNMDEEEKDVSEHGAGEGRAELEAGTDSEESSENSL